jgi:hypothetical protein
LELPESEGGGDRIPLDWQISMGEAFVKYFKHKKFMVRYPETFKDYDVGFYWDSFALPDDESSGTGIIDRDTWRTQMMTGEVAYDWGDQTLLGAGPGGTLGTPEHCDYVIGWIQKTHCSSLGWIDLYDPAVESVAAGAARMQKAFGYRYVIGTATYTQTVLRGETLDLQFELSNVGNAPFYYDWPVEVSLLDSGNVAVYKATVPEVDIRKWMPGETYKVEGSFAIPDSIAEGDYTIALAVLDPAGGLPSLRFANTNYYEGGYTPLGKVGVGRDASSPDLKAFDSLYADKTLHY